MINFNKLILIFASLLVQPILAMEKEAKFKELYLSLNRAITHGSAQDVESILSQGINPKDPREFEKTERRFYQENGFYLDEPLSVCIAENSFEKFNLLINAGFNVNYLDTSLNTPLKVACSYSHGLEFAKILVKLGANVNCPYGYTPLMTAINEKNNNIVQLLLENGAFLVNAQGKTALTYAKKLKNHKAAKLIEDKTNEYKQNVFETIKASIPLEMKKHLLMFYKNCLGTLNIQNVNSDTPLHLAIHRDLELAKWLTSKNNALINVTNNQGQTPLELGFGLWGESENWLNFVEWLKTEGYIAQDLINSTLEKIKSHVDKERKEVEQVGMEIEKLQKKESYD